MTMRLTERLLADAAGYKHAREEIATLRKVFGAILLKHGPLRVRWADIAAMPGTVSIATSYDVGTDEYIVEVLSD